jgi:GntR family transcriptional regulator, transcriptional repressor for pyruvate dehydrogenase complex
MDLDERVARAPQLPSRVAALLSAAIAEGRWKPGERLPTEQALAAAYGVSRNVVREAVSRLRADGIVQSRQGVGAFVTRSQAATLRLDAETLSDRATFQNVFELRAVLEIQAAGLAAERRSAADIVALEEALARMDSEVEGAEDGVDADLDYHRAIARATGNAQILTVVNFLADHVRQTIHATRVRPGNRVDAVIEVTIAEHTVIHNAIVAGDALAARNAMASHIRNAALRIGYEVAV